MTQPAADELDELKAILAAALERINRMQSAAPSPVVDREPPAEAYARVMARRRRRGR